uniref:Uncharacterized protein n=1 Tax=viral metagenome TaxID=1070528 RepID=A0A6M3IF89_9ZZZZ
MQTLYVKDKGSFNFVKTFADGILHIGKVPGGGYLHLGGQPVKNREELRRVIPDGPDLVEALAWFENRGKPKPEEKPKKKIVVTETGYSFEDGPITSAQDIVNNTAPGLMQENILGWWGFKVKEEQKVQKREASRVSRTVDEIRKEMAEKTMEDVK